MKLSDYVVSFLEKTGSKCVFGVTGGGAMHLNDSFSKSKKMRFIMTHHEQAAAMMSEAYARKSGKIGICHVTTGPGGTNTITGIVGAWIDSIPHITISGQVAKKDMINNRQIRQMGTQEVDIVKIVKTITKYAATLKDPQKIRYELEKCLFLAKEGKPGPVWLDIPLDIQSSIIDIKKLKKFKPLLKKKKKINFNKIYQHILQSKRPCFVIGNGIHLSNSVKDFKKIYKKFNFPILSSWNASDVLKTSDNRYVGRFGIFGDRASNFTIQNSDLIFVLGSRLSQPQTGYNLKLFAPAAKIIYVDIDLKEISKFGRKVTYKINTDLKYFLYSFRIFLNKKNFNFCKFHHKDWLKKTQYWKQKYPVVLPRYKSQKKVNSFYFIDYLSKALSSKACVVTDMGTSFTCTMQTFKTRNGQRLFTSSGLAAMGFGLPGSIGAAFADKKNTNIICISGDGGLMFNLQELQTIRHHNLPIKIFVLCNKGYLTMKLMQKKNFKKYVGSSPESGISCPDFCKVAKAFGIKSLKINNHKELLNIKKNLNSKEPFLFEIHMNHMQPLIPRLQTKMKSSGEFIPTPIDNLYPFLAEKEYKSNIYYKKI